MPFLFRLHRRAVLIAALFGFLTCNSVALAVEVAADESTSSAAGTARGIEGFIVRLNEHMRVLVGEANRWQVNPGVAATGGQMQKTRSALFEDLNRLEAAISAQNFRANPPENDAVVLKQLLLNSSFYLGSFLSQESTFDLGIKFIRVLQLITENEKIDATAEAKSQVAVWLDVLIQIEKNVVMLSTQLAAAPHDYQETGVGFLIPSQSPMENLDPRREALTRLVVKLEELHRALNDLITPFDGSSDYKSSSDFFDPEFRIKGRQCIDLFI